MIRISRLPVISKQEAIAAARRKERRRAALDLKNNLNLFNKRNVFFKDDERATFYREEYQRFNPKG